jgi:hypothetical protein
MVRAESVVDAPPAGPHDAAMARVVVTNAKPTGVVPLAAGVVVALATAGAVMLVALVALAVRRWPSPVPVCRGPSCCGVF